MAAQSQDRPFPRSRLSTAAREEINGWLFAMPFILGFIVFTLIPMVWSLYASFTNYNIIQTPKWTGLQNLNDIFHDNFFWISLGNTFWMVLVKTPLVIIIALLLALLLNVNIPGAKFFRSVIYLPNVLAGVAAVFLWQWILAPNGLLNQALGTAGIQGPAWFIDANWTKPGMVVMGMWWIGGNVLIFLASLKGIPKELYDAGAIDGAVGWNRIRYITLPLISPTIFFEIITIIIGTFQIFTTAYILSTSGTGQTPMGGPGFSMLFYVLYLYLRAFGKVGTAFFQMGYASALAWILFIIILVITVLQLWLSRKWVYYES